MKILNPSYDTIFKYLLEDLEISKGLISRIIDKEIIDIKTLPQEQTTIKFETKFIDIPITRQDFVATIKVKEKNSQGQDIEKLKKVMIEMQKSPFPPEITRFRKYLSAKYHHKTKINGEEADLPIITIYLIETTFNDKLPAVLYVKNEYYDRLTNKKYEGERDRFVDLLVHDAYFIQTSLLPVDLQNDLLRILSIFSPQYQFRLGRDDRRFIEIDEKELNRYKDRLLNLMIKRLNMGGKDSKLLTALELELEYEKQWEDIQTQLQKTREKLKQTLEEKEEARKREEEARKKAEQERKEKEALKIKFAKKLLKLGFSDEEIAKETGLDWETIQKLKEE